jgi:hypothetical protein
MEIGLGSISPDEIPVYFTINARDDDGFTSELYAISSEIQANSFVIATGPVSVTLARDALQAVQSLGAHLMWLAPRNETNVLLGLPVLDDEELLEQAYLAVEAAYPDLLDSRINVSTAPIAEVIFLAGQTQ